MICDIKDLEQEEFDRQMEYLLYSPVKGIAHRIKDGKYRLKRGLIMKLGDLGSMQTIYDNLGNRFAFEEAEADIFLVKEVMTILKDESSKRNDQLASRILSEIENFIDIMQGNNSDSYQMQYLPTILLDDNRYIVKCGNKRVVAFYDYMRKKGAGEISLPVYLVG